MVVKTMKCVYCNTKLDKRDKEFCPYCGTNQTSKDFVEAITERDEILNQEIIKEKNPNKIKMINSQSIEIQKIEGGIGEDNDMTAAGDYIATIIRMEKKLLEMGDEGPFTLISPPKIKYGAQTGNNFFSTVGITEFDSIIKLPHIKEWITFDGLQMIGSKGNIIQTGNLWVD